MTGAMRVIAMALMLSVAATAAHADPLAEARREKAALQYARAAELLDQALAQGDNGPERLAEIYRLAGEVAAGLGDGAGAEDRFARLLMIAPDAALLPGTSPKISEPFASARAFASERGGLRVHAERGTAAVTLIVDGDPMAMVAGARVRYRMGDGSERQVEAPGRARATLELPTAGSLSVVLAAVDEHGNELVRIGSWQQPLRWDAVAAPPPGGAGRAGQLGGERRRDQKRRYRVWPYAYGASATALLTGLYFGTLARDAQDELDGFNADSGAHEASEALDLEDRGRRDALIANVSFAVAGVSAAVATWLLVRDLRTPKHSQVTVVPAVSDEGVGVVFSVGF